MIRYALACAGGHEYDAWFRDSADFDEQSGRGLVSCPDCGTADVRKQIMAPSVSTSRKKQAEQERQKLAAAASAVRRHIRDNFADVGAQFPDEARAIHFGDKPMRAIYGQASPEEAEALREEGVEVCPLPPLLCPEVEKKVN